MTDTPENPSHADALPAPAAPPVPSPVRVVRLPSHRASAVLAAAMLAIGVAVGAAIGPAPDASLAGASRLPLLLPALRALASPSRTSPVAQPPAAAAAQATPPPAATTSSS